MREILKNIWPRREILNNTWASERNSEEYLGLGKRFWGAFFLLIWFAGPVQPKPENSKREIYFYFLFMCVIQHCFICRPSDSTVSEDAGIEPRTVATLALTARRSNQSARSHPLSKISSTVHTQLDLIHTQLDLIHSARSHSRPPRSHSLSQISSTQLNHPLS